MKLYRPSNREIKRLSSINNGKLICIIGEVCKGLPVIRAFKNQEWIIQEYIKRLNHSIDTWVLTTSVFIWLEVRIFLIGNFFFIASILTCIVLYGFELTKLYDCLNSHDLFYAWTTMFQWIDDVYRQHRTIICERRKNKVILWTEWERRHGCYSWCEWG